MLVTLPFMKKIMLWQRISQNPKMWKLHRPSHTNTGGNVLFQLRVVYSWGM